MEFPDLLEVSCLDELEKIAISMRRLRLPKTRQGKRSISVMNFLKKEKDGSLYKDAGVSMNPMHVSLFDEIEKIALGLSGTSMGIKDMLALRKAAPAAGQSVRDMGRKAIEKIRLEAPITHQFEPSAQNALTVAGRRM